MRYLCIRDEEIEAESKVLLTVPQLAVFRLGFEQRPSDTTAHTHIWTGEEAGVRGQGGVLEALTASSKIQRRKMQFALVGKGSPSGSPGRESPSSKAHGLWAPAQELRPKQEPRSSDRPPRHHHRQPGLFQFLPARSGAFHLAMSPSALYRDAVPCTSQQLLNVGSLCPGVSILWW